MTTGGAPREIHAAKAPAKRKRWVLRIALAVVAALVLLVALAPTIMSLDVVRRYAMGVAGDRLSATLSAQAWSLSWFGPQEVRGLSIQLPDGRNVVQAARIELGQGLIGLWRAPTRPGPIQIEQAAIWTEGAAAWCDALARQAAKEAPAAPPHPPPSAAAEGPPPLPQAIRIDSLAVHTSAGSLHFGQIALADVPDKEGVQAFDATYTDGRGRATVTSTIRGLRTDWRGYDAIEVTGRLTMTDLALALLLTIAKDFGAAIDGEGALSGQADFTRTRTGDFTAQAECHGTGISITGAFLKGDRPTLKAFRFGGRISRTGNTYEVTDLELADAPVAAKASATFTLRPRGIPTGSGAATLDADLKWLADALPKTLETVVGTQKNLKVESGSLSATVDMQSAPGGRPQLRVAADVKDLRGQREGKPIALQPFHAAVDVLQDRPKPADATEAAREPSLLHTIEVKSLALTGGFGSVTAKGRLEDFTLDAQLNLARATAEAVQLVDLKGYGGSGNLRLHARSSGSPTGKVALAAGAALDNVAVDFGAGRRWLEPQASLTAKGTLTFNDKRELMAASIDSATVKTSTATLAVKGSGERASASWTYSAGASVDGSVAGLAGLMGLALDLAQAAEPPRPRAAARDWRDRTAQAARELATAEGQVHLRADLSGNSGKYVSIKGLEVNLRGIAAPAIAELTTKPLKADEVKVTGDLRYDYAAGGHLAAQNVALVIPGFSATLTATADLGKLGTDQFQAAADLGHTSVDLGQLTAVLAPFGLLPAEPTLAGALALEKLTASAQPGGTIRVAFSGQGKNVDIRWSDGRRITEPAVAATAEADLTHDTDWHFTQLSAKSASVEFPAGALSGTVAGQASPKGWTWNAKAAGQGEARPLAQTVARLLNREAGPVEGRWQVQASYKRTGEAANDIDLTAAVSGLTVPVASEAGATGAREANVPLGDVGLVLAALVSGDRVEIRRADLAGGGIKAMAQGTVRFPAAAGASLAVDATVRVDKADFAVLEKTLKPFGVIPAAWRLSGKAKLAGNATTAAGKVSASGTLDVADLNMDLGDEQIRLAEPSVHLRATFSHEPQDRRWEFAADGIESGLVRGSAGCAISLPPETQRAADADADAAPAAKARAPSHLEARWDLVCDAKQALGLLGSRAPKELVMSGPWKASGHVAGTIASEGPWNQQIAGLVGSGNLEIAQFRYEGLAGGNGVIRWGINQGQVLLSNDPAQPSRLSLAGGTATLGGWIDLRGPVARLYMAPASRLSLQNVRLSEPGVSQYLRFTTPILAGSVNENGRLSGEVDRLDFPLDADGAKKATAGLRFTIYEFQTELQGGLATILGWYGQPTRTPVQTLGPIDVQLAGGVFRIKEHQVVFGPDTAVLFKGDISVEKQLNIEISMPLTATMLKRFGVASSAAPYLVNQRMSLPLTGTTDKPGLDEKLAAKRIGQLAAEAVKRGVLKGLEDILKKKLK